MNEKFTIFSGEFVLAVALSFTVAAVTYRMFVGPAIRKIRPTSQVPLREAA